MFRNYLKSAFRNLRRHPLYTSINLFGLAVGLAFVMLIFLFIRHELSYDQFLANAENIYRVDEVEYSAQAQAEKTDWLGYKVSTEGIVKFPYQPVRLGEALTEEIPEIRQFSRFDWGESIVQKDQIIHLEEISYVDANFFELFSFPLVSGDPVTVLDEKNEVVITPELGEKYFGRQNPVGEELILNFGDTVQAFTVSGIAAPPPLHSSLDFQLLVRIENRPFFQHNYENWNSFNTPLFLELIDGASYQSVKPKIDAFTRRQYAKFIEEITTREGLGPEGKTFEFILTPMLDVHLDSSVSWPRQGNATNILILGGIALLILLIACLNYISLSLTGASGRMKEVGVRKVLGSTPGMVARQFWLEAQVMVLMALILAVALLELFLPTFNNFVQRELHMGLTEYLTLALPLLLIGLLTGLISGVYPAAVIARFRPATILKGNETYRHQPGFIKGAVVVQFSLSVFLIISSLIMSGQMEFINTRDLGYTEDQVLVLQTNTGWNDEGERLMNLMREALRPNPDVRFVSGTNSSFNRGWNINGYETPEGERHRAFTYRIDHDYLKTLDIELLTGRDFSPQHPADITESIIVNEALVKDLGIEGDPIGAEVPWREDHNRKIIGVVKDFHFLSLEEEIQPMIMHLNPDQGKIMTLLIKMSGQNIPQVMAAVESSWKTVAPNAPFDYSFLDEDVARQYESFLRWTNIMRVSTIFAIFIACLGLFGLTGIMTVNKTKEIGIRKVLGATVADILLLLNRDLVRLTIIALLIAAPAAWYAMKKWLENFEFRIEPGWTIIAVAGLTVLVVTLLTVSYHSLRAALSNPVDSLKYE